jgi:hypothetical protein
MRNKYPPMKLSLEEESYLRHWIYDEAHFLEGVGTAKRLQVEHQVRAADLADLIAAAIPEPADQEAASLDPPTTEGPEWPWTAVSFRARVAEARGVLSQRHALRP